MKDYQDITVAKWLIKATRTQRMVSAWIFLVFLVICVVFWLAAYDKLPLSSFLLPCGFKMRTGLPCPACGCTTATLAFFRGDILRAFYTQPASAVLCVLVFLTLFLSFIISVFGVYFSFLKRLLDRLKLKYLVISVILVILGGWAVTIARALS